jgi:hypothetical protein
MLAVAAYSVRRGSYGRSYVEGGGSQRLEVQKMPSLVRCFHSARSRFVNGLDLIKELLSNLRGLIEPGSKTRYLT